jgi:hypothetical protein
MYIYIKCFYSLVESKLKMIMTIIIRHECTRGLSEGGPTSEGGRKERIPRGVDIEGVCSIMKVE